MRTADGHGVEGVDWPPELRVFKTADTTHYVAATTASASTCATCGQPLRTGERRSLTVEVRTPDPPPPVAGFLYRQFAAEVHHRSCRGPELTVVTTPTDDSGVDPFSDQSDMHYLLVPDAGAEGIGLPGLVFTTSDPIVVRDLELAEGRSAWMSTYLQLGFELFAVDDLALVAALAPITTSVRGTLDGALFSLTGSLDGREACLLEWTRNADHPAYRQWRRAVSTSGALFVLYGEYIQVDTDSGTVGLAPGGRLGDIAAAVVRVDVVPPATAQ